jgi:hypothetical protein
LGVPLRVGLSAPSPRSFLAVGFPLQSLTQQMHNFKLMNKDLIRMAIISAIQLISDELNSIEYDDLKEEFEVTLDELNLALEEINKA